MRQEEVSRNQAIENRSAQAATDRIRVRREWVGAPSGTLSNPTIWLFVASVTVFSSATWAYVASGLPAVATIALNTFAIYIAFTVMHESMHGIAHHDRTVNRWLGRPMALLLGFSAPMFRAVHYEHHSHTNDPDRDPDLFIAAVPAWLLPLWAPSVIAQYRAHYYSRKLWRNRAELGEALGVDALLIAIVAVAVATGNLRMLTVVWLVPSLLAVTFLAIAFDYLPHYPYDSRERYRDTRVCPGRVGFAVLLGQNYHLIHHLWTTVPWYRYPRVFNAIRPELEARGARIGWRIGAAETAPSWPADRQEAGTSGMMERSSPGM